MDWGQNKMVVNQRVRELRKLFQEEIGNIESNYDFIIRENRLLSGGMRSNTVYLDTNNGKKVVKIYPNNFSYQLIDFQARACIHLHDDNIPAPNVVFNSQNRLVTPIDDTNYIVMDHLEGEPPRTDDVDIINLTFRPLARVLNSLSRFDYSGIRVAPELEIPLSEQLLELSENIIRRGKNRVDPVVWDYNGRLNDIYSNLSERLANFNLPTQLVLGDYNSRSILVNKGEVKGIVDFDFLHLQGKGYDFMHLFDILFVDKLTKGISLEQRVDFDKIRKAMTVYSEEDADISSHITSFPTMLQLLGIRNLVDVWGNYYAGRSDRGYFDKMKEHYIPRLEVGVQLEDRIIETLSEASSK